MFFLFAKRAIILAILIFLATACSKDSPTAKEGQPETPQKTNNFLVDSLATPETVALFRNLKSIAQTGLLFGHQDDLAYGIGWNATPGRSDVKEVCGDYPAVYGWDLGDIHLPANLDGVNFQQMKGWIKEVYQRGGVNTISLHLDNPATGDNSWDNSPAVKQILPGQSLHLTYLKTLDYIAAFLQDLKAEDGTFIPIVLRPYHEHNHTWPWWGASACSVDEYNALWRMTVEYLRDTHNIHHLLYAISPQDIHSEAQYLERYPGDEWVDILGTDYYLLWDKGKITSLGKALHIMAVMAEQRNKVSAITEIGIENIPIKDWWTNYLLAAVMYDAESQKTAWALVWRNQSKEHHFGPYPGHTSAPDFLKFYQNSFTLFENELPDMYK